jgi:hypothetical protein
MKITNTTRGDIGLQPEMIVPAMGSIEVKKKAVEHLANVPSIVAHFEAGRLKVEGDEFRAADLPDDVKVTVDDPDRAAIVAGIIRGLDKNADFTKGGKPEVDAINAAMVKGAEPVTAAERDAVWEGMSV